MHTNSMIQKLESQIRPKQESENKNIKKKKKKKKKKVNKNSNKCIITKTILLQDNFRTGPNTNVL